MPAMPMKAMWITALCLLVTACGGASMGSSRGDAAGSGSSGSSPTSHESGYGLRSGSSGDNRDGQMDWGE